MFVVTLLDNISLSLLNSFVSLLSEFTENFMSVSSYNCSNVLSFVATFKWVAFASFKFIFFNVIFMIIFQLFTRGKILVIRENIF